MIWRQIGGWPYEVSDTGKVRNQRTGYLLTPMRSGRKAKQYSTVRLCAGGQYQDRKVPHLVLEAFVGPRPSGLVSRHRDDDTWNNAAINLCWGTSAENADDRRFNTPTKLTVTQAAEIKRRRMTESGSRLANEYGVSPATICDIHKGRTHRGMFT